MGNSRALTERQKAVETYLRCAANLYGFITPRAFLVLFNRYNEPKLLKAELMKYRNKLIRLLDGNYCLYENAITNALVSEDKIDEIICYQNGKSFFIPEEAELLKYENQNYYEVTDYTKNMRKFLCEQFKMNPFAAEALLRRLSWLIRIEASTQEQMALLEDFRVKLTGIKQANEFLALLADMSNNTRKWANCGYTPIELSERLKRGG